MGAGPQLPVEAQRLAVGSYIAARVHAGSDALHVTAFLRRQADGFGVVGIERAWPGKVIVTPPPEARADRRVYEDLSPRQRELFTTSCRPTTRGVAAAIPPRKCSSGSPFLNRQRSTRSHTRCRIRRSPTPAARRWAWRSIGSPRSSASRASMRERGGGFAGYLREPEAGHARRPRQEPRVLPRPRQHRLFAIRIRSGRSAKSPTCSSRCPMMACEPTSTSTTAQSRSPQSLFNGHLTASNSDVRAGENPTLHNARWQGLVLWWQGIFGRLKDATPKPVDVLGLDQPDGAPTPLPPDRPMNAAPDKIEDAAQEFLTDWLVRRQYNQALAMLSSRSYACVALKAEARGEQLDAAGSRRELRRPARMSGETIGAARSSVGPTTTARWGSQRTMRAPIAMRLSTKKRRLSKSFSWISTSPAASGSPSPRRADQIGGKSRPRRVVDLEYPVAVGRGPRASALRERQSRCRPRVSSDPSRR